MSTTPASWVGSAWSCTVRLVVDDPAALRPATADLCALLERVDQAASRFRPDSALTRANAHAGRPTPVPKLLVELVDVALTAARHSAGAVDPTLGLAVRHLGYDRDIADVAGTTGHAVAADAPRPGRWRSVRLHREAGLLTVPAGTALDLGATAKAWTADRAARQLAGRYGTTVLVELGGDLAVAGCRPSGWRIRVAEREGGDGQVITLHQGGLATSTTTVRTWVGGGEALHHVLNPHTGRPADGPWRTATVAAPTALAANTASTHALVRGAGARDRLTRQGLAARLVDRDGRIATTAGWPQVAEAVAA